MEGFCPADRCCARAAAPLLAHRRSRNRYTHREARLRHQLSGATCWEERGRACVPENAIGFRHSCPTIQLLGRSSRLETIERLVKRRQSSRKYAGEHSRCPLRVLAAGLDLDREGSQRTFAHFSCLSEVCGVPCRRERWQKLVYRAVLTPMSAAVSRSA